MAMLFLGFALTNHHLTGFLLLPGIIAGVTLGALDKPLPRPGRLVLLAAALVTAALLTYALVPVRGMAAPSMILGRVENFSDFMWLISAKVYQKSLATGWSHPGDVGGVLFIVAEQIGPWLAIRSRFMNPDSGRKDAAITRSKWAGCRGVVSST